jgi:LuxR family maltose regulon positive regulatory protein
MEQALRIKPLSNESDHQRFRPVILDRERHKVVPLHAQHTRAARTDIVAEAPTGVVLRGWRVQSLLLEAIVYDDAGDPADAEDALGRALAIAEHDRLLLSFLVPPVLALLERHAAQLTPHADLIAEMFDLHAAASEVDRSDSLREPLTDAELRVLRLLPTDLTKREIGDQLYLSVHTIKTHIKHLYDKLDVHTRREAVDRARELGLLARPLSQR